MSRFRTGSRVMYRVGRGYGEARITNIDGDFARLMTTNDKYITRRLSALQLVGALNGKVEKEETLCV
jgi:hypothetical protein